MVGMFPLNGNHSGIASSQQVVDRKKRDRSLPYCQKPAIRREENHSRIMADKTAKFSDNVSGKFYVDENCIDCDLCREIAPGFFTRNDDEGHSFVHAQPSSDRDIALCLEAMNDCPVEAIGDDGCSVNSGNKTAIRELLR
jgi:ferredoxin